MKAPKHPSEAARLSALRAYDILDTPRESDFDDVVNLASRICETPISVINLIDADRQWFKAETGLGVRETPLESSLCAHAILSQEFLEIPDTMQDDRMCDNPLCIGEPGLRFYAGALLKTDDGLPIGTLCVLDTRPRKLTDLQRTALQVLAAQVTKQLNLRQTLRQLKVLRHEADHRVKNSLSLLNALTRLQSRGASGDETRKALEMVQSRIATIGAFHGAVSQTGNGTSLRLDAYLADVSAMLRQNMPDRLALTHDLADCTLAPSRAASVAMIVNEWVMNAVKHGFPADRDGTIHLTGLRDGDVYTLTVSDDGVGIGNGSRPGGIGLEVSEAAARQIEGAIRATGQSVGTGWMVRFPVGGAALNADGPAAADKTPA